jgi:hypothetical protein
LRPLCEHVMGEASVDKFPFKLQFIPRCYSWKGTWSDQAYDVSYEMCTRGSSW